MKRQRQLAGLDSPMMCLFGFFVPLYFVSFPYPSPPYSSSLFTRSLVLTACFYTSICLLCLCLPSIYRRGAELSLLPLCPLCMSPLPEILCSIVVWFWGGGSLRFHFVFAFLPFSFVSSLARFLPLAPSTSPARNHPSPPNRTK